MTSELGLAKRQFGHRARLVLSPAEIRVLEDQAHGARTMWNCLHSVADDAEAGAHSGERRRGDTPGP